MKFYKYGIVLERLREEDIELVRMWRNSDPVRLNMNYQELISAEQQQTWFRSVNNLQNNYMMIHYEGRKIGLLNDKNIDWDEKSSESGLFLGERSYYNTFVPYLVSLAGIETTFYFLNWNRQTAHIMRSNKNAIEFNRHLGYGLTSGQELLDHQQYEVTRESFEYSSGKIRKAVRALTGNQNQTKVLFEPIDYQSGIAQKIEKLLAESPKTTIRQETPAGIWYIETGSEQSS